VRIRAAVWAARFQCWRPDVIARHLEEQRDVRRAIAWVITVRFTSRSAIVRLSAALRVARCDS
jgi:hypothetical protein